ncbi:phage terminase small subunit P27 family [Macrococcoides goetzii]|uniref:phage terminase small subunit P27 family n=1 Tax=Staphylococcaceae TaxID=90964 RepID=UPI00165DB6B1|nr:MULTISPECIES: phage terminase small subunit P27 family [Macrococcus]MBC9873686.1 phage terminase small subunit P27 family [Macrococcus bohemicus]MCH4983970.1 phage terminase small subunit P27 family [Macrococcus sp. PK]
MGNQAQPIELQLIKGNKNRRTKAEIEKRRKAEEALKAAKDKLKPPTWLDKGAKKEFRYIVNEMSELDVLNNLDVHALAMYCDAYSNYVEITKLINENGLARTINLTEENSGEAVKAIYMDKEAILRKKQFYDQVRQLGIQFGFTPSARAKMALSQAKAELAEEDEEFDV